MKITNLKIQNFRNYLNQNTNFLNNTNIIIGKNGSGKTNLVEAIYILAFTKSFRGSNDKVVINQETKFTKIKGIINENKVTDNYEFYLTDDKKEVKKNNSVLKQSDYVSNINVVLFNPDDLKIIKDSPSERRKFMNLEISQINNDYLKAINYYNKLIKQRNNYLKTIYVNGNSSLEYLDILTDKIIEYGIKIHKIRKEYLNKINVLFMNYYYKITGIRNIKLEYKSDFNNKTKEEITKKYRKLIDRDVVLGKTTFGIHHDDFVILFNNQDIKDYGSEGQQKNAIISIKLSEVDLIKTIKGTYPILILDDLFSELDKYKINNILKYLKKSIQVFITITDINKINNKYLDDATFYRINKNRVEEMKYGK